MVAYIIPLFLCGTLLDFSTAFITIAAGLEHSFPV